MTDDLRTRIACVLAGITPNNTPKPEYVEMADAVIRDIPELQARCDCQTKNWAAADGIPLDWLKLPEWSLLKDDSKESDDDD